MKRPLYALAALLLLTPAVQSQQQGGAAPGPTGQVGYIFLPSPTVSDAESNSQPVPRLPDGKVDLTGPWVGGGSNATSNVKEDCRASCRCCRGRKSCAIREGSRTSHTRSVCR
jgi:hypothetical protein